MSIKLMSQVWEAAEVSGSELLVLLSLADYANDDGTSIYPAMPSIAKKARLSVDQARRVIHKLIASGLVELVQQGGWIAGRNRPNEYRIVLAAVQGTCKLQGGGMDARRGTRADASTVLAPVQEDPPLDPSVKPPTDEDDNARARGAVIKAWQENMPGTITPILAEKLFDLLDEVGARAVIHGITTGVEAGARNFKYIAACARNHAAGKDATQRKAAPVGHRLLPTSKVQASMDAVDSFFAKLREQELPDG